MKKIEINSNLEDEEDVKEIPKAKINECESSKILKGKKEEIKVISKDINLGDEILPSSFTGSVCCWQCLKLFQRNSNGLQKEIKSSDFKEFCSEICLSKYKNQNSIECFRCKTNVLKSKALTHEGEYYCSDTCINKKNTNLQNSQK